MPIVDGTGLCEWGLSAFCGGMLLMAGVVNLGSRGPEAMSSQAPGEGSGTPSSWERSVEPNADRGLGAPLPALAAREAGKEYRGKGNEDGVDWRHASVIEAAAPAVLPISPPQRAVKRADYRSGKPVVRALARWWEQTRVLRERSATQRAIEAAMADALVLAQAAPEEPEEEEFWQRILVEEQGRYLSDDKDPACRIFDDSGGRGLATRLTRTYTRYRNAPTPTFTFDEDRKGVAFGLTWLR